MKPTHVVRIPKGVSYIAPMIRDTEGVVWIWRSSHTEEIEGKKFLCGDWENVAACPAYVQTAVEHFKGYIVEEKDFTFSSSSSSSSATVKP